MNKLDTVVNHTDKLEQRLKAIQVCANDTCYFFYQEMRMLSIYNVAIIVRMPNMNLRLLKKTQKDSVNSNHNLFGNIKEEL